MKTPLSPLIGQSVQQNMCHVGLFLFHITKRGIGRYQAQLLQLIPQGKMFRHRANRSKTSHCQRSDVYLNGSQLIIIFHRFLVTSFLFPLWTVKKELNCQPLNRFRVSSMDSKNHLWPICLLFCGNNFLAAQGSRKELIACYLSKVLYRLV